VSCLEWDFRSLLWKENSMSLFFLGAARSHVELLNFFFLERIY